MAQNISPGFILPNGQVLLKLLALDPRMVASTPYVPIATGALKALLGVLVSALPFDEDFYARTYPDLAEAKACGEITSLHDHFLQYGYAEGRLGSNPEVDDAFYLGKYPDVAKAIETGRIRSASEHFIKMGATEGRFANAAHMQATRLWRNLFNN